MIESCLRKKTLYGLLLLCSMQPVKYKQITLSWIIILACCLYFAHFTPSLPSDWPMESRLWHLCRHIQPISEVIFVSLFIPHFQVLLRNPSVNLTSFSNRTTFLPVQEVYSFCLNSVRTGDVFCTDTKDIRGDAAYAGLHVISSVVQLRS